MIETYFFINVEASGKKLRYGPYLSFTTQALPIAVDHMDEILKPESIAKPYMITITEEIIWENTWVLLANKIVLEEK